MSDEKNNVAVEENSVETVGTTETPVVETIDANQEASVAEAVAAEQATPVEETLRADTSVKAEKAKSKKVDAQKAAKEKRDKLKAETAAQKAARQAQAKTKAAAQKAALKAKEEASAKAKADAAAKKKATNKPQVAKESEGGKAKETVVENPQATSTAPKSTPVTPKSSSTVKPTVKNPATLPQKPKTRAEKRQLEKEKEEALRELDKLREQIKRGIVPPTKLHTAERPPRETEYFGEKLPYTGGFPVYCCKYVIIRNAQPCVAMRFFNASDVLVTGLRFTITQKNGEGETLSVTTVERNGLFVERSTEFAVADATVSEKCVTVEVRVNAIKSDSYEYVIDDKGEVTLKYGTSDLDAGFYFKNTPGYSVKRRHKGYIFLSVLAVLGFTAIALLVVWQMGGFSAI